MYTEAQDESFWTPWTANADAAVVEFWSTGTAESWKELAIGAMNILRGSRATQITISCLSHHSLQMVKLLTASPSHGVTNGCCS